MFRWIQSNKRTLLASAAVVGVGLGVCYYLGAFDPVPAFRKDEEEEELYGDDDISASRRAMLEKAVVASRTNGLFTLRDVGRLEQEFANCSNGDGSIHEEGFFELARSMGVSDARLVRHLFRAWDRDASGSLTFEELLGAIWLARRASSKQQAEILFSMMDDDDSGLVDGSEALKFINEMHRAAGVTASLVDLQHRTNTVLRSMVGDNTAILKVGRTAFIHHHHAFAIEFGPVVTKYLETITRGFMASLAASGSPLLRPASGGLAPPLARLGSA